MGNRNVYKYINDYNSGIMNNIKKYIAIAIFIIFISVLPLSVSFSHTSISVAQPDSTNITSTPNVAIISSGNPALVNQNVTFTASVENIPSPSYLWEICTPSGAVVSNQSSATLSFSKAGCYEVGLAVSSTTNNSSADKNVQAYLYETVLAKTPNNVDNITVYNIPATDFKNYNISSMLTGYTIYGSSYNSNGSINAEVQAGGSYNILINDTYNITDSHKEFQVIMIDKNTTINFAENGTTYYGNSILTSANNVFKPVDITIIYGLLMMLSAFILIRFGNYQIFALMMVVEIFLGYIISIKYINITLITVFLFILSILFVRRLTGDLK